MLPIIEAISPVFSLIIIGFIFKRYGFPGDPFWSLAERATYYAFFPALLVNKLAVADFAALPLFGLSSAIITATLLISLLILVTRKLYRGHAQAFTSIFQGSIRPNTYIGLAAGGSLFGEEGLAIIAMSIAQDMPTILRI